MLKYKNIFTKFVYIICTSLFISQLLSVSTEIKLKIKEEINQLIKQFDPNAHIGIKVSSDSGEVFYSRNSNCLFIPASNGKIFTAIAAMSLLGPNLTFKTEFLIDGQIKNGVLNGNLILRGSGDPSFKIKDLEKMVLGLKKHNITSVNGEILLDDTNFDNLQSGPGWAWDDGYAAYRSPINGLNINHNNITINIALEEKALTPIAYLMPQTNFVTVCNFSRMSDEQNPESYKVKKNWLTHENTITISGYISKQTLPKSFEFSIENPTEYVGSILKDLLAKNNVQYNGKIYPKKASTRAKVIISHDSDNLSNLLSVMLKDSDNLYAECIFKSISKVLLNTQGTWNDSKNLVKDFVKNILNIDSDSWVLVDGCGMSRYNLTSPAMLVDILNWIKNNPDIGSCFCNSLPRVGVDGTLLKEKRMVEYPNCKSVTAKTGTMLTISTLSGYLKTQDGEDLTFSILVNNSMKTLNERNAFIDKVCNYFASFKR